MLEKIIEKHMKKNHEIDSNLSYDYEISKPTLFDKITDKILENPKISSILGSAIINGYNLIPKYYSYFQESFDNGTEMLKEWGWIPAITVPGIYLIMNETFKTFNTASKPYLKNLFKRFYLGLKLGSNYQDIKKSGNLDNYLNKIYSCHGRDKSIYYINRANHELCFSDNKYDFIPFFFKGLRSRINHNTDKISPLRYTVSFLSEALDLPKLFAIKKYKQSNQEIFIRKNYLKLFKNLFLEQNKFLSRCYIKELEKTSEKDLLEFKLIKASVNSYLKKQDKNEWQDFADAFTNQVLKENSLDDCLNNHNQDNHNHNQDNITLNGIEIKKIPHTRNNIYVINDIVYLKEYEDKEELFSELDNLRNLQSSDNIIEVSEHIKINNKDFLLTLSGGDSFYELYNRTSKKNLESKIDDILPLDSLAKTLAKVHEKLNKKSIRNNIKEKNWSDAHYFTEKIAPVFNCMVNDKDSFLQKYHENISKKLEQLNFEITADDNPKNLLFEEDHIRKIDFENLKYLPFHFSLLKCTEFEHIYMNKQERDAFVRRYFEYRNKLPHNVKSNFFKTRKKFNFNDDFIEEIEYCRVQFHSEQIGHLNKQYIDDNNDKVLTYIAYHISSIQEALFNIIDSKKNKINHYNNSTDNNQLNNCKSLYSMIENNKYELFFSR